MPTLYYLEKEQALTKTHVTLALAESADAIVQTVVDTSRTCLQRETKSDWMMPAGPAGFVTGSSQFRWSVEDVRNTSNRWLALRMDSQFHAVPMALALRENPEGGTEVTVYRANAGKRDQIETLLRTGEIFCHFREVSYPYD